MAKKQIGTQTVFFENPPSFAGFACAVGKREGDGPLRDFFDYISDDSFYGEKTWELAESAMQKMALSMALDKAGLPPSAVDCVFAGDLLNQCIGSSFGLRDLGIPYWGLYGACSTMSESLALAAMAIDGGFADAAAAVTSSHFCSAERQFRLPLEYGGQRAPSSQWTVTGSGAAVLTASGDGPYITHVTLGKIVDMGVTDANNMGAAMAPAAYDTISAHLKDVDIAPAYYDMIVTGDLASIGSSILIDAFKNDGIDLAPFHNDCGLMIFSNDIQDVKSGGSGCGCPASVLTGYLLSELKNRHINRILFAATGAMMSTISSQQGGSIPGICYAVSISNTK